MRNACREAEVNQLYSLFGLVEQDILKLNVSVCYVALVAVVNGLDDLSPDKLSLQLWHLPIGLHFQIAMQAASIDILHHEEDLLVALENLKELCDMLMIKLLHDLHLALDRLASVWLHQLSLLVYFDSDLLI